MRNIQVFITLFLVVLISQASGRELDEERIVGGSAANIADFKYQVSLQVKQKGKYTNMCGGSIISERWVLTAAHCLSRYKPQALRVVAGSNYSNGSGGSEHSIKKFEIHEEYNDDYYKSDIAMLQVDQPFGGPSEAIIEMAKSIPPAGTLAVLSGWGKTEEDGEDSDVLLQATVSLADEVKAKAYYKQEGYSDYIHDHQLYTKGDGKDACQGDSGGPLVYGGKQIGVVSWGEGCGSPGSFGVYTAVPYYIDWSNKIMDNTN